MNRAAAAAAVLFGILGTLAGPASPVPTRAEAAGGVVRVAYPDEPRQWYPPDPSATAATDLAALWGLPLYHLDSDGQLRPALAAGAEVRPGAAGEPWEVDVRLREGEWSDGSPVTAEDVVATVAALRPTPHGRALRPLEGVTAVGSRTVRLRFAAPYARWPYLLAGGWGVLPAAVLTERGLAAYDPAVPVSGGPFRLTELAPGLRAVFSAHLDSPLGPPALERIEVYFTPRYETALGLLRDRRVDLVAGHLAVGPLVRARRVEDAQAAAPLGGTWVGLQWRAGAGIPARSRRVVAESLPMTPLVEGLLAPYGAAMTSLFPGVEGPWQDGAATTALDGVAVTLVYPDDEEVPGLAARAAHRALMIRGASVTLVPAASPEDVARRDAEIVVRRDVPHPALLSRAPSDADTALVALLAAADGAGADDPETARRAQQSLRDLALEAPLFRVAVAHAWHRDLGGVRPSAWPGLAFWSAAEWRWPPDGPPDQQSTLDG